MIHNSSPEITKKKVKTGHKKQTKSRRTLSDVNEIFRILPDDGTAEINKKNEQEQTDPKKTINDKRKYNLNNSSKNMINNHVPMPKMIKKNEKENINNCKTFHKKRDMNECFPPTIIPDKKVKETDKISKAIKEDTRKNQNYKQARVEVVDKVVDRESLRKNDKYFREEDILKKDVRKKFNSIVRDEAKGDVKHNSKLVADLKINSKPMGDVIKTNRKSKVDEKDSGNRGGGDIGKPIKTIKLNENKKIDDKRIYSNIKEVPFVKPFLDLSKKKLINDRYTIRLKNGPLKDNTAVKTAKEINSDVEKTIEKATPNLKTGESSEKSIPPEPKSVETKSDETKLVKKPIKTDSIGQRKPIIKTVRVKNDNRVFKSVTFVDRKQPTPLLISIPTHYRKSPKRDREQRHTVKHKTSKDSFVKKLKIENEKSAKVKKRNKKRRILSPDLFNRGPSPPTEVAKWAPSCMTHQTKPYYEAWVDTTLAATTKCLKNDEFSFHKQHFVKAFKTALETPMSEEIVFDKIGDERYTGKIRVRRR